MAKVAKVIGIRLFTIQTDNVCKEAMKGLKRWLDIKKLEHRNFCPFITKHASCQDTCGHFFEGYSVARRGCPRFDLTPADFSALMETLYSKTIEHRFDEKVKPGTSLGI